MSTNTKNLLDAYAALREAGVSDYYARHLVNLHEEDLGAAADGAAAARELAAKSPEEFFEGGRRPEAGESEVEKAYDPVAAGKALAETQLQRTRPDPNSIAFK